ncbi:MAG: AMP-dependent synthetase/ligase [Candidatus Fonsibacter sp.]|jgi:long-chain acyl-CoA synthetase|uniref:AMP-dependent synthetase/ligase n=1 Tax=Candidatus Fonsibacter ubiquis TaxID=1925548 RepID=UPI000C08B039|nr:AMP-binding protein [Candidatus Fonsibacter ubiquis]MBU6306155.1 AMP-binding protein [Pseudomonadota bacterium]GBL33440.1 putative long-chain-fatty-acid--CoA ligase [Pelagibacterales bacterium]NCU45070.1 long-chain fatty acid--CoA ligase [Candidatus Fonsibacter ubiquis]NCU46302.1 long-chain fatty acid--CoA ligase [Candidatus Fonsibacter ubiquis]NCU47639.1 long-chain fatty acid--CoA ligase [Candidatus Fonsibacter ubiquis]
MKISNFKNLNEISYFQFQKFNKEEHLYFNNPNLKKLEIYTWSETRSYSLKLAKYLNEKNVNKGDRVLIVSENRPEWLIVDLAILFNGAIAVPNYTTYTINDFAFTINDCKPVGLIVSNDQLLNTVLEACKKINYKFNFIIYLNQNKFEAAQNIINFSDIKKNSIDEEVVLSFFKDKNKDLLRIDPACIIYTSGTQGTPKGVILSHGGILKNCEGALEFLDFIKNSRSTFLTWLPLSHSYEHTVQFVQLTLGAKIFYSESLDKLMSNLKIAKPTIMTAVPRFYTNLVNKIKINLQNQSHLKKIIFQKTLQLGEKKVLGIQMSFFEKIINFILDLIVRKKIKNQFGGKIKAFISGGGPLDYNVGLFLNSLGLPTLQGYGLTEASPVVSCNPINKIKIDTVGKIFKDVSVNIASDGEILVKGENLMLGYWNNQIETEKIIKNGWLYTGDIGEIDNEGYLKITDRKKDIIVNAGGDNIAPSKIENLLANYPEIIQSYIYGDKKNYLVALIVVSKELEDRKNKIRIIIDKVNQELSIIEKIKKFIIIDDPFTIENQMLTPTMKIRRHQIKKVFGEQLEKLYF